MSSPFDNLVGLANKNPEMGEEVILNEFVSKLIRKGYPKSIKAELVSENPPETSFELKEEYKVIVENEEEFIRLASEEMKEAIDNGGFK